MRVRERNGLADALLDGGYFVGNRANQGREVAAPVGHGLQVGALERKHGRADPRREFTVAETGEVRDSLRSGIGDALAGCSVAADHLCQRGRADGPT